MERGNTFNLTQVDLSRQNARKLTADSNPFKISADNTLFAQTPLQKFNSKAQFDLNTQEKVQNKLPRLKTISTTTKNAMFQSMPGSPKLKRNLSVSGRKSPEMQLKSLQIQDELNKFIQEAKLQADEELKQLYAGSPKILQQTIRKVESSRNIMGYVQMIHSQVINIKNVYSKYKFERENLELQNKKLQETISNLGLIKSETVFWQQSLEEIENRYTQMLAAVENEVFQQSRLEHLISQKIAQIKSYNKPISDLRQEITKKHFEISEETQKLTLKKRQLTEKKIWKQKIMDEQTQKRMLNLQEKENNQQIMKEYFLFQGICEKERDLNLEQKKKQQEEKAQKEQIILKEKEQQEMVLEDEMKKNQEYIKRQDRMFQKISDVTNINNISDMYAHLIYLQDTAQNLQKTKDEHNQKIRQFTSLIEQLQQELNQLKYSSNDIKNQNASKRQMESKLQDNTKKLDNQEEKLKDYEDLLSQTIISISKLATQLSDKTNQKEINPLNCSQKLAEIGLKLERMDGNMLISPIYMGVTQEQCQKLEKFQEQNQGSNLEAVIESDRQFYDKQKNMIKKESNKFMEAAAKAARANSNTPKS